MTHIKEDPSMKPILDEIESDGPAVMTKLKDKDWFWYQPIETNFV